MSLPAIEARSLSSLTALASNPPSYPRNPTHVKHEPLVLYIARVPGSRDVFLSPMKPRDKVVTAEDITNSLYFVHVEQPEDSRFFEPPPAFQEPDYEERPPALPNRPQAPIIQRKAISSGPTSAGGLPLPKRKPLPGTLAPVDDFGSRQNVHASNYSQSSSSLLRPDYSPRRSFDSSQYQAENERPPLPPRTSFDQSRPSGTSLTIIRRDPASGAQWNIARIDDPPVLAISSSTSSDLPTKKKIGAPVYIEITNPGYSKFLHSEQQNAPSLLNRNVDLSVRLQDPIRGPQVSVPETPREERPEEGGTFRRRLWMEGTKYANGGFGHRRLDSHDSNTSGGSPRNSVEGWQRERSSVDIRPPGAPPFLSRDNQSYSTIQVSDRQSSFRGYVFMSPWNGRCEFITGGGGGSLKCRHVIPGLQGASPIAMPVSELRFNLPSSSKASTPRGDESSKRSSFFHRPRHSRHNSSVSDYRTDNTEDVRSSFDRMDLSLGQEFAGGGFGGKQAKLGKLIIEDEGLKMVDLLVAANMALWWRAYEKRDTKSRVERGSF